MRYITGDEVGLIKITKVLPPAPEPVDRANTKKRRRSPEESANDQPEPSAPPKETETRVFGHVNRTGQIQLTVFPVSNGRTDYTTLVVARWNGVVEYWDIEKGECLRYYELFQHELDERGKVSKLNKHKKPEHFIGLSDINGTLVACTDKGNLFVIRTSSALEGEEPKPANYTLAQDLLFHAVVHPRHPHLLATGGDERDLCLWDLRTLPSTSEADESASATANSEPTWRAKNVKNDFLDLRVPVWITQIAFMDASESMILCGTGYHQLRVYNTSAARRPVINIEVGTHPVRALSLRPVPDATKEVVEAILSDTTGQMFRVQVSVATKAAKVVSKYLGLAGAVSSIALPDAENEVASVGLDRFLRVYDLTDGKKVKRKVYLKQRLTTLLLDERYEAPISPATEQTFNGVADDEDVWDKMEEVHDKEDEVEHVGAVKKERKKRKKAT
ncbi:WD repeat-containing protein 74 [Gaertneriomyces sp. JEL0708]|nr:WD repeat-containing protein 74 [Gaertneriomyces sp. JEL0708]